MIERFKVGDRVAALGAGNNILTQFGDMGTVRHVNGAGIPFLIPHYLIQWDKTQRHALFDHENTVWNASSDNLILSSRPQW